MMGGGGSKEKEGPRRWLMGFLALLTPAPRSTGSRELLWPSRVYSTLRANSPLKQSSQNPDVPVGNGDQAAGKIGTV